MPRRAFAIPCLLLAAAALPAQAEELSADPLCMDRTSFLEAARREFSPEVYTILFDPKTGVMLKVAEPLFILAEQQRVEARRGDAKARASVAERWMRCRIKGYPATAQDNREGLAYLRTIAADGAPGAVVGLATLQATGLAEGPADLLAAYQTLKPLETLFERTPPTDAQGQMRSAFVATLRKTLQIAFDMDSTDFAPDADINITYQLRAAFRFCSVPVTLSEVTPGLKQAHVQRRLEAISARFPRTGLVCQTPTEGLVAPLTILHPKAKPPPPPAPPSPPPSPR